MGFREMLHYLNQNEKDFTNTHTPEYREFTRLLKPLWDDPECLPAEALAQAGGNGPVDD